MRHAAERLDALAAAGKLETLAQLRAYFARVRPPVPSKLTPAQQRRITAMLAAARR